MSKSLVFGGLALVIGVKRTMCYELKRENWTDEPMNCKAILEQWVAAINGHDSDGLAALMSADHLFVDSLGNRVTGAKSMEAGWRGYFAMCPDYWIRLDHAIAEGETLLAEGEAGGTIDGEAWRTPAAWKAVIRGDKVAEWRVFADNKRVYEILGRRRK